MDAKAIWVASGTFYISWFNLTWEFLLASISYINSVLFPQPVLRMFHFERGLLQLIEFLVDNFRSRKMSKFELICMPVSSRIKEWATQDIRISEQGVALNYT